VSEGISVRFAHRSDEPVIGQLGWKNSRNSRSNASEQGARRQRRKLLRVVSRVTSLIIGSLNARALEKP
jgi:hypothetical protein